MLLDRLTPAWQSLERRLRDQCVVVVAHPSPLVRDLLAEQLSMRDVRIEIISPDAWFERATCDDFAIAVTAAGAPAPGNPDQDWFVVCESSDDRGGKDALRHGATDVTLSALGQEKALVRRLNDRVTDRTARRVLDLVVLDLKEDLEAEGLSGQDVDELELRLQAFRARLGKRPAVAVVDQRKRAAARLAAELSHRVCQQVVSSSPETLLRACDGPVCPLVAVIPAVMPGSRELAAALAKSRAQVELLVTSPHGPERSSNLEWSDWVQTGIDDQDIAAARAALLYRRARLRLLYQQLLMALTDALSMRPRRTTGDSLYEGFEISEAFVSTR
ncbi:MAG: hypothetical protein KJO07_16930 [Deltaproteobacteria bacterium]|nr:hypothetical protein [Deltaproteobacteria bacterium]